MTCHCQPAFYFAFYLRWHLTSSGSQTLPLTHFFSEWRNERFEEEDIVWWRFLLQTYIITDGYNNALFHFLIKLDVNKLFADWLAWERVMLIFCSSWNIARPWQTRCAFRVIHVAQCKFISLHIFALTLFVIYSGE